MNKIYVVNVIEIDSAGNAKLHEPSAFVDETDAETFVRNDMENTCDTHADAVRECEFDEMYLVTDELTYRWSITETELSRRSA